MNKDHEYYVAAGNSFKLIGLLCAIISFMFFLLGYDIKQIDYVDLFLTGSYIFVFVNIMVQGIRYIFYH